MQNKNDISFFHNALHIVNSFALEAKETGIYLHVFDNKHIKKRKQNISFTTLAHFFLKGKINSYVNTIYIIIFCLCHWLI